MGGTLLEDRWIVAQTPFPRHQIHNELLGSHVLSRRGLGWWTPAMHGFRIVGFFLCLVAATQQGLCQSTFASVNGTVRDQNGAVISGAKIALVNIDSGVQHIAATGSAGVYSIGDIPPGNYSARAPKDCFTTEEKTGLTLQVNQTATPDFRMMVGSHEETVAVASNLSAVDSTTSALGTVITTLLVTNLPLNGRNFTQLLALTPGVSPVSVAQNSTGGAGFGGHAIGEFSFPAVNGQRNRSNMFLLGGAAFAIPVPYTFGNFGRNSLRSDWFRNLDCSLFRRLPIGDVKQPLRFGLKHSMPLTMSCSLPLVALLTAPISA